MRIASGPEEQAAEDRRRQPGDDEQRAVSVGQRETADADRDQRCGRDRRVACGPRLGRSPREREHDGEAGDRSRRATRRRRSPRATARTTAMRDQPPRKAEPVDAMVDRGLECRGEDDPEREAGDRPDERSDRPDDGAVGQQHEAEVLLRGADGSEHAQLAEPSLRDDREACGGNQRGQEEEDGGDGEHRQRLRRAADVVPVDHRARGESRAVALGSEEGVDATPRSRRRERRPVGGSPTRGRRAQTRRSACSGSRRCRRRSVAGRRAPGSTRSRAAETPPRRR